MCGTAAFVEGIGTRGSHLVSAFRATTAMARALPCSKHRLLRGTARLMGSKAPWPSRGGAAYVGSVLNFCLCLLPGLAGCDFNAFILLTFKMVGCRKLGRRFKIQDSGRAVKMLW